MVKTLLLHHTVSIAEKLILILSALASHIKYHYSEPHVLLSFSLFVRAAVRLKFVITINLAIKKINLS